MEKMVNVVDEGKSFSHEYEKSFPLVSIIIPVFNGEKYVFKCLYSVSKQTYINLEIIIINDGSKDNSLKICNDFQKSEQRAYIINNENHGVGYSRNCGLKFARGEYILFVDCDDIIPENYVEEMTKALFLEECDLAICKLVDVFINEDENFIKHKNRLTPKNLTGDFFRDYCKLFPGSVYLCGAGAKLYKKRIIDEHNITFPIDISWGEDQAFNHEYYRYIRKFVFTEETYYSYCHRDNMSLSQTYNRKNFNERFLEIMNIKEFLNKTDVVNKDMVLGDYCFNVIGVSDLMESSEEDERNDYTVYKKNIKLLQNLVKKQWKGSNWKRRLVFCCFDYNLYFPYYFYIKLKRGILSKF